MGNFANDGFIFQSRLYLSFVEYYGKKGLASEDLQHLCKFLEITGFQMEPLVNAYKNAVTETLDSIITQGKVPFENPLQRVIMHTATSMGEPYSKEILGEPNDGEKKKKYKTTYPSTRIDDIDFDSAIKQVFQDRFGSWLNTRQSAPQFQQQQAPQPQQMVNPQVNQQVNPQGNPHLQQHPMNKASYQQHPQFQQGYYHQH